MTTSPTTSRFGVDGASNSAFARIAELNAEASGINGPSWAAAQTGFSPNVYGSIAALKAKVDGLAAVGLRTQLNFLPNHLTAMDTSGGKLTGLKAGFEDAWQAMITFLLTGLGANVFALQIGSEEDNNWKPNDAAAAAGYAQVIRLARAAARLVNPSIKVMAGGFNFGNRPLLAPMEPVQGDTQTFVRDWMAEMGADDFDVLSLHLNWLHESTPDIVAWCKAEMQEHGYLKPIWADDMASGPFYDATFSDPDDYQLRLDTEAGDPEAVAEYAIRQAMHAIIKPVVAFGAGVERVFLSNDTTPNIPGIPLWAYQHLVRTADGVRMAAFYAYQQLVAAIQGFLSVQLVATTTYKFNMPSGKTPVYVAWAASAGTVDLSTVMSGQVLVRPFVYALDDVSAPIYPAERTVSSKVVPVSTKPVMILMGQGVGHEDCP